LSIHLSITVAKDIKKLSDKELIKTIIEDGDPKLFGFLYDRYANKVYQKCISMVKSREDARDLTHDILVKAFLNIASFVGNSNFSTWLYSITYNQCIDFLRARQKARFIEYEDAQEVFENLEEDGIEEKQILEMEVGRLQELLNHHLSEEDRIILTMKYQGGMTVEQIQDVLGIRSSAVKMRLKRARDRLRKKYIKTYGKKGDF